MFQRFYFVLYTFQSLLPKKRSRLDAIVRCNWLVSICLCPCNLQMFKVPKPFGLVMDQKWWLIF